MNVIHDTPAALSSAVENLNTAENAQAKLRLDQQAFADQSDGTVNEKLFTKAAATVAGLPIIAKVIERRNREVLAAHEPARVYDNKLINECFRLHSLIDAAITDKVLATVGPGIRGAVNVRGTDVYISEQTARAYVRPDYDYIETTSTSAQLKAAAAKLLASIARNTAELERSRAVARKYNVLITAGALIAA